MRVAIVQARGLAIMDKNLLSKAVRLMHTSGIVAAPQAKIDDTCSTAWRCHPTHWLILRTLAGPLRRSIALLGQEIQENAVKKKTLPSASNSSGACRPHPAATSPRNA